MNPLSKKCIALLLVGCSAVFASEDASFSQNVIEDTPPEQMYKKLLNCSATMGVLSHLQSNGVHTGPSMEFSSQDFERWDQIVSPLRYAYSRVLEYSEFKYKSDPINQADQKWGWVQANGGRASFLGQPARDILNRDLYECIDLIDSMDSIISEAD